MIFHHLGLYAWYINRFLCTHLNQTTKSIETFIRNSDRFCEEHS